MYIYIYININLHVYIYISLYSVHINVSLRNMEYNQIKGGILYSLDFFSMLFSFSCCHSANGRLDLCLPDLVVAEVLMVEKW